MKKVPYFLIQECHKCGLCDEPRLGYAGPHIKATCNNCGAYIKFINTSLIPDTKEIKLRIFDIVDKNIEQINSAKKEICFIENLKGVDGKIQYWRLYLYLRNHFKL